MKNYLTPRYSSPLLSVIGTPQHSYRLKFACIQFKKWMNDTYPNTYADVKEGDHFVLYNGDSVPVPFVQLKDETPDKYNKPTRLLDGSYLFIEQTARVRITTKEEVILLKSEVRKIYN